eukprot:349945-Chlamydomonas_euryale.AAC.3
MRGPICGTMRSRGALPVALTLTLYLWGIHTLAPSTRLGHSCTLATGAGGRNPCRKARSANQQATSLFGPVSNTSDR